MPPNKRTIVGGRFLLDIDGKSAGFVKSMEGGDIYAEVVTEPIGATLFPKKHIAGLRYEPISLQVGMGMGSPLYDWMKQSMAGNYGRHNGVIAELGTKNQVLEFTQFYNALITEITFPKLDGASKDAAFVHIKLMPEYVRRQQGTGSAAAVLGTKAKNWLASNFRLEIDGLDCKGVSKIDAFTWKQVMSGDDIGDVRDYLREPGKIEIPNLKITLSASHAQTWLDWFDSYVIKGESDDTKEKSGSIVYLAPDLKTELARVKLINVGIFRLAREKVEANSENIRRLVADLYCERMELVIST